MSALDLSEMNSLTKKNCVAALEVRDTRVILYLPLSKFDDGEHEFEKRAEAE